MKNKSVNKLKPKLQHFFLLFWMERCGFVQSDGQTSSLVLSMVLTLTSSPGFFLDRFSPKRHCEKHHLLLFFFKYRSPTSLLGCRFLSELPLCTDAGAVPPPLLICWLYPAAPTHSGLKTKGILNKS